MKFINLNQDGLVWTLTLQRPEALNALNQEVLTELSQALEKVQSAFPKNCRGLIVTGQGEKAFVAGADIKEMKDLTPTQAESFARIGQKVFRQIELLPIPVIAAVNGFALGGGLELAMACDFIYASENARMGLPEVSLGLIPGFGGTHRLARLVGLGRAREMTYSGQMIKADLALSWGLVNRVLPLAELLAESQKTLQMIASQGPLAVEAAKRTILKSREQDVDSAMTTEALNFSTLFSTQDTREGTSAFVEKRKAQFQGQ